MGIYYETNLCFGKFISSNEANISKKFKIPSIDPIIEQREWDKGCIEFRDLAIYVAENFPELKLIESSGEDLFMSESQLTTLEPNNLNNNKCSYILVKKNYSFIQ